MNIKAEHPVWNLYDESRTARLNVRYYEKQLAVLRRNDFLVELVLALSVSSGVAGLWFWETVTGGVIWKVLVSVATVLAVAKPLFKLSDQIQQKTDILTNWRLLDIGLRRLTILVNERRGYDEGIQKEFHILMETKSTIVQREPPDSIDESLRTSCFHQVNQELPPENFFVPQEDKK